MNIFTRLFYKLTLYYPRPLPRTEGQYLKMKYIMIQAYGLEDRPAIWAVIASSLQNVKKTKLRIGYGFLINPARRLSIDGIAEAQKRLAYREIEAMLEKKTKETADALKSEEGQPEAPVLPIGTHALQRDVPSVQESTQGMVLPSEPDGLSRH